MTKKVTVLGKYLDFTDILLEESANIFSEQTWANEHAIKLKKGKQLPYGPIDSVRPVELETFKIYINTNLANNFIKTSKLLAGTLILFVCKPIVTSAYMSIIKGLITLQSKIEICYP